MNQATRKTPTKMLDFTADVIDIIVNAAVDAGEVTLEYFQSDVAIQIKDNNSPVTIADQKAEKVILKVLRELTPDIPIVAEEEAAAGRIPDHTKLTDFWLIDPLDGTKEFIKGRPEYTVNIALVRDRKPYFGLIYVPVLQECFYGFADADHAWQRLKGEGEFTPINGREVPKDRMTVVSSINHNNPEKLQAYLSNYTDHGVKDIRSYGSALKFCRMAQGYADFYPRFAPTSEWDTAAGHAILQAIGGEITTHEGDVLGYAKRADFLNPLFIARTF